MYKHFSKKQKPTLKIMFLLYFQNTTTNLINQFQYYFLDSPVHKTLDFEDSKPKKIQFFSALLSNLQQVKSPQVIR